MKHEIEYHDFSDDKAHIAQELFHQHEKLLGLYTDQLLWWNKKINLVSRDVSRETIQKHVLHSLVISTSDLFKSADYIVDTGTGGGLPGIPLSILHPDKAFVLNDIVSKKMMACKQIVAELKLNQTKCEGGAIADLQIDPNSLIVTKHAFKLNDLYFMIRTKPWSGLIMLKGTNEVEKELNGIEDSLHIQIYDLHSALKDPFFEGKAIVEIKKIN